jgi:hypothetical protein
MSRGLPLRWSFDLGRLRIYVNWILPTGGRILRKGPKR